MKKQNLETLYTVRLSSLEDHKLKLLDFRVILIPADSYTRYRRVQNEYTQYDGAYYVDMYIQT